MAVRGARPPPSQILAFAVVCSSPEGPSVTFNGRPTWPSSFPTRATERSVPFLYFLSPHSPRSVPCPQVPTFFSICFFLG